MGPTGASNKFTLCMTCAECPKYELERYYSTCGIYKTHIDMFSIASMYVCQRFLSVVVWVVWVDCVDVGSLSTIFLSSNLIMEHACVEALSLVGFITGFTELTFIQRITSTSTVSAFEHFSINSIRWQTYGNQMDCLLLHLDCDVTV